MRDVMTTANSIKTGSTFVASRHCSMSLSLMFSSVHDSDICTSWRSIANKPARPLNVALRYKSPLVFSYI